MFMLQYAKQIMSILMMSSDLFVLGIVFTVSVLGWQYVNPTLIPENYVVLFPYFFIFILVFAFSGLYPGIGLSQVDELKRITLTTTIIFLALGTLTFYSRSAIAWSRGVFAVSWMLSMLLLPNGRKLFRLIALKTGTWGIPTVIIGYGPRGRYVVNQLKNYPELGFLPVIAIDIDERKTIRKKDVYKKSEPDKKYIEWAANQIRSAIILTDEISKEFLNEFINDDFSGFQQAIMISGDMQIGSLWVQSFNLAGVLGLGFRQNVITRWQLMTKRIFDLGLIFLFLPVLIMLFLVISFAIRLDSPGRVFYKQKRVGQNGKPIFVWKFRTMVSNADEILEKWLKANSDLRKEWDENHKLKNDPRITRVGRFLRRMSLDELPQMMNVLQGDMSLIGPRPIVEKEIIYYGKKFQLYKKVLPGLSGLWQISGRNDVSYTDRVLLDEYYVRNWSIWLDFYIVMNTFWAIITGKGAY